MTTRHQVTLTVHNLKIDALMEDTSRGQAHRSYRAMVADKVQVTVSSSKYSSASRRDSGDPTHSPATFRPKVTEADGGSDTQPTITVNRKTLGEVTVAPASVTAGSKQDFTITYKATEAMVEDDVIEIKLPADVGSRRWLYQLDDENKLEAADGTMLKDAKGPLRVLKWIRH